MNILGLVAGAGFGFVLAGAKLHEYATIHATLRLDEPDVFLLMGCAIGVSLPLLWLLEKRRVTTMYGGPLSLSRSRPQRHHVIGGALFGLGWALAGTCPAPALAMVSSGALLGLVAIAGLFTGLHLRDRHVRRVPADSDGEHRMLPEPAGAGTRR
jgi:uncharacterized membrane protein YedE/YeeE